MGESMLQELPGLKAMLVCDTEGVILLRAGNADEAALQRMSATFAQTTEHAHKLGLGKNQHMTAFYENSVVVHANRAPLVLTLLADADANVALLLDALPQLVNALEPLQQLVETLSS